MLIDEFLKQLNENKKLYPANLASTSLYAHISRFFPDLEQAKHFYIDANTLNEIANLVAVKFTAGEKLKYSNLPFDCCVFEFEYCDTIPCSHNSKKGFYVVQNTGDGFNIKVVTAKGESFQYDGLVSYISHDGTDLRLENEVHGKSHPINDQMQDESELRINSVLNLLFAINCEGLLSVETKKMDRLNKARARKGKPPLKEYSTIKINIADRDSDDNYSSQSGSCKPRRKHIRRGHFRHLPGKVIWVRNCIVGKGEKMAPKKYIVSI